MGDLESAAGRPPPSVAWLYTAQDECALDSAAFAQVEPELERAIWAVVGRRADGPPQGLQAAVQVLGERWRSKHVPQHDNNPALLLLPYLSAIEREALLRDVTSSLVDAMDELALKHAVEDEKFRGYAQRVEEIMRERFLQQLAIEHDGRCSRAELEEAAANTTGAALAQLWRDQLRLHTEHLPLLRGHTLPPPLRAHVWQQALGGDGQAGQTAARVRRQMQKDGVATMEQLDASPLAAAVRRTAQELFSSRRALQSHDLSSPALLNVAVRVLLRLVLLSGSQSDGGASVGDEGAPSSTRRLQRALLLLAPILFVFPPPKHIQEPHLMDLLGKLVAADQAIPTLARVPALALDVARLVRAADPDFASTVTHLYHSAHHIGGSEGAGGAAGAQDDRHHDQGEGGGRQAGGRRQEEGVTSLRKAS